MSTIIGTTYLPQCQSLDATLSPPLTDFGDLSDEEIEVLKLFASPELYAQDSGLLPSPDLQVITPPQALASIAGATGTSVPLGTFAFTDFDTSFINTTNDTSLLNTVDNSFLDTTNASFLHGLDTMCNVPNLNNATNINTVQHSYPAVPSTVTTPSLLWGALNMTSTLALPLDTDGYLHATDTFADLFSPGGGHNSPALPVVPASSASPANTVKLKRSYDMLIVNESVPTSTVLGTINPTLLPGSSFPGPAPQLTSSSPVAPSMSNVGSCSPNYPTQYTPTTDSSPSPRVTNGLGLTTSSPVPSRPSTANSLGVSRNNSHSLTGTSITTLPRPTQPNQYTWTFYDGDNDVYTSSPVALNPVPTPHHVFASAASAASAAASSNYVTVNASDLTDSGSVKRQRRARAPKPPAGGYTFVLYTPADAEMISSGVAPSGGRGRHGKTSAKKTAAKKTTK